MIRQSTIWVRKPGGARAAPAWDRGPSLHADADDGVEHDRELVLACRVLGQTPSVAERQEPVLELLTDQDSLPELLVCDGNGAAELMAPIATALGIELFVGPTLVLDALREDLLSTILQ